MNSASRVKSEFVHLTRHFLVLAVGCMNAMHPRSCRDASAVSRISQVLDLDDPLRAV